LFFELFKVSNQQKIATKTGFKEDQANCLPEDKKWTNIKLQAQQQISPTIEGMENYSSIVPSVKFNSKRF